MMLTQENKLAEGYGVTDMLDICYKKKYDDDNSVLVIDNFNDTDSYWTIYDLPKKELDTDTDKIAKYISDFVSDIYGPNEAEIPSWDINKLASWLSTKLSKEE